MKCACPKSGNGNCADDRFGATHPEAPFHAFRKALKDIAADIWNLPADCKAQRLLVDGLQWKVSQHYDRKRPAWWQWPTDPGSDGRPC